MVEEMEIKKPIDSPVIDVSNYNKCVHFILPMLGISLGWYINLINCYVSNPKFGKDNYLYILNQIEDPQLEEIDYFNRKFKIEADNTWMYVYDIPNEYHEDFLRFIRGEYSKFTNEYKNQIYKLLKKPFKDSNVYKVLNKSLELKVIIENKIGMSIGEQEVLSVPNLAKETCNE